MKKIFLIFAILLTGFALFADELPTSFMIRTKRRFDAFSTLERTFENSKKLIADNDDREKLSATVAKIQSLYKNKKSPYRRFLLGVNLFLQKGKKMREFDAL